MLFTVACTLHFYCNWAIACTCCWARHQGLAQISNCCDRLRPRSWLPLSAPFPLWVAWIKYIFSQCASIRSCHIIDQLDSIECKMNKINQTSSQHVQAISKKVSMLNQSQDKCKAIICCPKERGATVSWVHPRASWVVEPQHHRAAWWEGLGCGAWAREGGLYDWDWGLRSGVWGGWEVWGGEGGEQWGADVGWGEEQSDELEGGAPLQWRMEIPPAPPAVPKPLTLGVDLPMPPPVPTVPQLGVTMPFPPSPPVVTPVRTPPAPAPTPPWRMKRPLEEKEEESFTGGGVASSSTRSLAMRSEKKEKKKKDVTCLKNRLDSVEGRQQRRL